MHRALECSTLHSLRFLTLAVVSVVSCSQVVAASVGLTAPQPLDSRQLPPPPIGAAPLSPSLPDSSQASFTDGGGSDFNPPAILWIVFASLLGLPLATAGVRGWRITSGAGLGLLLSFFIWCTFVNTTSGTSLAANPVTSDLYLSLFVWGCFLVGVAFGSLRIGILAGVSSLGASGGVALGILLALLRPGLLVPIYAINIVPIGILGAAGAAWPIWHQRLAVIVSSSACGSFLIGLAIDLVLNKQSGISLGIRFLLDRNPVHIAATLKVGYQPTLSTLIIVGVSIGLIPVFSYIQHRVFRQPFDRTPESLEAYKRAVNGTPILGPGDEGFIDTKGERFAIAPQHVRMRFPSIVPSLPGQVDPRYTAQQQAMRIQKERMEMQNGSARPLPTPGIGRMNVISPAMSAMTTAARRVSRMSTHFANGFAALRSGIAERRVSTLSVPSIYSVATMDRSGGNQRQQQNGYGFGGRLPPPQPEQLRLTGSQYDYNSVYSGAEISPVRPLELPNRQYTTGASRNAAPPSSQAPSTRSGISNNNNKRVAPPPPASLRSHRTGWGANGLPPSPARGAGREQQAYNSGPSTPRSAGSSRVTGNRLKPAPRYNLL